MHTNCLLTGFGGKKFSISTAMTAQKDRSTEHRRMIFSALAGDHDAARRHVWGFFGAQPGRLKTLPRGRAPCFAGATHRRDCASQRAGDQRVSSALALGARG
jgi:hypothetical protein